MGSIWAAVLTLFQGFTAAILVVLYKELYKVADGVLTALQASGRDLPKPKTRPMQEVA